MLKTLATLEAQRMKVLQVPTQFKFRDCLNTLHIGRLRAWLLYSIYVCTYFQIVIWHTLETCLHSPQDIDELITRKRKAQRNPEAFFESLMNGVSTMFIYARFCPELQPSKLTPSILFIERPLTQTLPTESFFTGLKWYMSISRFWSAGRFVPLLTGFGRTLIL